MREIKFRSKRLDNGEWVYGSLLHQTDYYGEVVNRWFITDGISTQDYDIGFEYEVDEKTIGQFTGIKDKNCVEIYEGDITKGTWFEKGKSNRHIGFVKYIGNAFKVVGVKQYLGYHDDLNSSYKVIGNIYENTAMIER